MNIKDISFVPVGNGIFMTVDLDDYDRLSKINWCYRRNAKNTYVTGCVPEGKGFRTVTVGRFILKYEGNLVVDHINGDVLDNRKQNLRLVTFQQNTWNSKKRKDNQNKNKWVRPSTRTTGKWEGRFWDNGKYVHVGTFNSEQEAVVAMNNTIKEKRGEYARLNKIDGKSWGNLNEGKI